MILMMQTLSPQHGVVLQIRCICGYPVSWLISSVSLAFYLMCKHAGLIRWNVIWNWCFNWGIWGWRNPWTVDYEFRHGIARGSHEFESNLSSQCHVNIQELRAGKWKRGKEKRENKILALESETEMYYSLVCSTETNTLICLEVRTTSLTNQKNNCL